MRTRSSSLPHGQPAIVWTDTARQAEGMRLLLAMGDAIEPKAIGGPGSASLRPGQTTVVPLGLRGGDDLRAMVITHKPRWILALTNEDVHPDNLPLVDGKPVILICREPLPPAQKPGGARVVLAGAMLDTPGLVAAQKQALSLGGQNVVNVVSTGAHDDAALLARLVDAWDAALAFAPFPDRIHAALFGPMGRAPSALEGLSGRLTAHGVLPGEGSISLLCADSGPEHRSLDLVTEKGNLHATPAPDGAQLGRGDAILAQWRLLLAQDGPGHAPSPKALACCAACLLSLRTGSPENPGRMLALGTDLFSSGETYPLFA